MGPFGCAQGRLRLAQMEHRLPCPTPVGLAPSASRSPEAGRLRLARVGRGLPRTAPTHEWAPSAALRAGSDWHRWNTDCPAPPRWAWLLRLRALLRRAGSDWRGWDADCPAPPPPMNGPLRLRSGQAPIGTDGTQIALPHPGGLGSFGFALS